MKINIKKALMAAIAIALLAGHALAPDQALLLYKKGCEVISCERTGEPDPT